MSKEEIIERIDIIIEGILDGRVTNYSVYDYLKNLNNEIKNSITYKIAE